MPRRCEKEKEVCGKSLIAEMCRESYSVHLAICSHNERMKENQGNGNQGQGSEATEQFCRQLNCLFDILNSWRVSDYHEDKAPITPETFYIKKVKLLSILRFLRDLKLAN